MMVKGPECIDLLADMLLADLCTHDHRLLPVDIDLEVTDGFVSSVRDQDNILEAGVVQIVKNRLKTAGVRCIAGKCPVVYRHVPAQCVDNNLQCLGQRKVILVLPIADIGKGIPPGAAAGRVYGAQFVVLQPCGAKLQKIHPVLLRDLLRQHGDIRRSKRFCIRSPGDPLPGSRLTICILSAEEIHRQGHDTIRHLPVAAKDLKKVSADPGCLSDLLQKPDIAIKAVFILALYNRATASAVSGKLFNLAEVPAFRKDQL